MIVIAETKLGTLMPVISSCFLLCPPLYGSGVADLRCANSSASNLHRPANFVSRELLAMVSRCPPRFSPSNRATARRCQPRVRPYPETQSGWPTTSPSLYASTHCPPCLKRPRGPFEGRIRPSDSCCRRSSWRLWKRAEGVGNVWSR